MGANDWEMEAHPRHEWRNRRPTADQMQGSRHLPTAVTWLFCGPRRRRRPFYLGRFHFPPCPSGRPLSIDTLAVHGVFPFLQPTRHLTQALVYPSWDVQRPCVRSRTHLYPHVYSGSIGSRRRAFCAISYDPLRDQLERASRAFWQCGAFLELESREPKMTR